METIEKDRKNVKNYGERLKKVIISNSVRENGYIFPKKSLRNLGLRISSPTEFFPPPN